MMAKARKWSGSPKGVSNGEWRTRMKAEYTCVDAGGNKYAIVCDTCRSIDEIKALAVAEHKAAMLDVVNEKPIGGNAWAEDDEPEPEPESDDEKNDGLDDGSGEPSEGAEGADEDE